MVIKKAEFTGSYESISKCPVQDKHEYAFIGRSNVGKSSLINMLCQRKGLAKTSGTPGKTRTINYFLINDSWYIVDLPGYGYAKISKEIRERLKKMIENYIFKRENLVSVFVLIDCRHEPQKIDVDFINNIGQKGIPFKIIFTKADKISSGQLAKNISVYKNELLKYWEELPDMIATSSETHDGRDVILDFIEDTNKHVDIVLSKK